MSILTIYAFQMVRGTGSMPSFMHVPVGAAAMALATIVIGAAAAFFAPYKYLMTSATVTYSLMVATLLVLIIANPGYNMFTAMWVGAAVFSAMFGTTFSVLIALTGYIALTWGLPLIPPLSNMLPSLLVAALPVAISKIIWRRHSRGDDMDPEERMYNELTSELSQVSTKAEVVINVINDGVIALDKKGTIVLINPAAQRMIGWGQQDALNLDYKSVLKLVDSQNHELKPSANPIEIALRSNKSVSSDNFYIETNSGKHIAASIVVSPVGKSSEGGIIVFRDITDTKAEEKEQAEFISTASHEMRTPVASIEGYLGLVLNPAITQIDDKARDYVTKAHESARHLGRLFQDLLDVTKADDGRMTQAPRVLDTAAFLEDIVLGLKPRADEKGLDFIYRPLEKTQHKDGEKTLDPVYYVHVDPDHLREIVSNLVENAVKYTPSGAVTVDVSGNESHVTISVTDTGIGIPKEDQAHLFQKFYRVDNSDTREIGGTGLGLYLSRRLTEQMGGKIWIESAHQQGSTFYLEFPRVQQDEIEQLQAEDNAQTAVSAVTPPAAPTQNLAPIEPVAATPPAAQAAPSTPPAAEPAKMTLAEIEKNKATIAKQAVKQK